EGWTPGTITHLPEGAVILVKLMDCWVSTPLLTVQPLPTAHSRYCAKVGWPPNGKEAMRSTPRVRNREPLNDRPSSTARGSSQPTARGAPTSAESVPELFRCRQKAVRTDRGFRSVLLAIRPVGEHSGRLWFQLVRRCRIPSTDQPNGRRLGRRPRGC